jgi:NADP-dependent 3-hydroxy acid dehydrogenase YdfG
MDKVALVTGASSGIAKAAAIALQEAGFYVIATAPSISELSDLKAEDIEALALDLQYRKLF